MRYDLRNETQARLQERADSLIDPDVENNAELIGTEIAENVIYKIIGKNVSSLWKREQLGGTERRYKSVVDKSDVSSSPIDKRYIISLYMSHIYPSINFTLRLEKNYKNEILDRNSKSIVTTYDVSINDRSVEHKRSGTKFYEINKAAEFLVSDLLDLR